MSTPSRDKHSVGKLTLNLVYRRYAHVIYDVAFAILRDHDDAEGVVQRFFVKLRPEILIEIPESRLLAYLRQGGRNEALRRLSEQDRDEPLTEEFASGLVLDARDPCDEVCHAEIRAGVWQLIESLPPRCRLVMAMLVGEGLTQREVAEHLSIGINAVEKQVYRAHSLLHSMPEAKILYADLRS